MKTITLAHYYTSPEVQAMADFVGDSLDLAQIAVKINPDRIVFAGVKFMAESAKMLLPNTEVILPHQDSTCSLVTQTDIQELREWQLGFNVRSDKLSVHIMYINSSAEMKAEADVIVTSRNVEEICQYYHNQGKRILFSPDYNMGMYLKYQHPMWDIEVFNSVCEVHDKFKLEELEKEMRGWTDGSKSVIAHPESPMPILKKADFVGSTSKMLDWVKNFPYKVGTIWVATEENLLYNMRKARPELDIRLAPTYSGCQCNACPYMAMNTPELVQQAIDGTGGVKIDYLTDDMIEKAVKPLNKMMEFNNDTYRLA